MEVRAHWGYLKYVLKHKWFVFWECCKAGIPWRGLVHDLSKFSPSEWPSYVSSFFGPWKYRDRPAWLVDAFDLAWLHHQKRNKHHWQYWVLIQDEDEEKILPMPLVYRKEMLADWRGAGKAITGSDNTPEWYSEKAPGMKLHPETVEWMRGQLYGL
jgi:hypothetical protein